MSQPIVEELDGSELGTKEYWDKSYDSEFSNYVHHGDVGEIWFDEDSQLRIINWILKHENIEKTDKILDVGCGNGMMTVELAREGFTNLVGIDYSENAIQLASRIAKDQEVEINIQYKVVDLLCKNGVASLGKFRVIHDKGTYDAISLHPDNPKEKRTTYLENISNILENDGLFIITSCNWTEAELVESFKNYFTMDDVIPTPQFKFGGFVGNVVSSVVFNKKVS